MRKLLPILAIAAVLLLMAAPAFAAEDHTCDHTGDPIVVLHHCVEHAYEMGRITSKGVRDSLLAKLDAAQAAQDGGNNRAAINMLLAFINEVNAQTGKAIGAEHAGHLLEHANSVIGALGD